MKMDKLGEEVSDKIKSAVRAKLTELGIHIDNELPDYVMVLVANKKSQEQMEEDLRLFLGESTVSFTTWLMEEKVGTDLQQPKLITYTDDEQMTAGDDDDTIQLHDNNEGGSISERPESSLGEKLLPDAKQLLGFEEKNDKYNGDKEDVKPRERIKISWDNNNAENKKKAESKEDLNLANNQNNNENKEWEFNKIEISANFSTSVNEISSGDGEKSSVHEKSDYIGSKIMDARDILKKRSSLSSKVSKSENRTEKRSYSRRSSKDKGSKDN
uniref:Zinc finger CCCH domain-containing protein 14 n=1 Tax=Rhodnius prolixus TaxID=13249 RepID=T1IG92_RHOPR